MKYEEALKVWGAMKLNNYNGGRYGNIDPETVKVSFNFNEGYACCGGSDPDCYCSFAESPRAEVVIRSAESGQVRTIPMEDFDFAQVLKEIVEVGGGNITG